jgi:hypothetical protein
MLAAATKPDERCEAQFYLGEWYLLRGDRAAAAAALQLAVDTCPKPFYEYDGAVIEQMRLFTVFKTEPLKLLIAHYVDEDLLQLVAVQHRRGRRLFIITTNIDAQRTAVWNMGAIAASDYSGRLQLFRDILVASASAPGLFAPAYIEVQAGNARFQEMHVDGAVTSNVLAVPESVLLQKVAFADAAKPRLHIIVNGKITPDFAVIDDGTLSITGSLVKLHLRIA